VNTYVESNFVLELALLQEQHASCEELVRLSEAGKARLVIPAFSLFEPYGTLVRRHRQRKQMKADLDNELGLLTRTATYSQRLGGFQSLTALLTDSADEETKRLEEVRSRLLRACEVISLEKPMLTDAAECQIAHGLSPPDALVYVSVLSHLAQSAAPQSCFLNRNSKDFDDPDIVDELKRHGCTLIPRFDHGLDYIRSHIDTEGGSA
jgi:predicted nucleic acid-binding protein